MGRGREMGRGGRDVKGDGKEEGRS